MQHLHLIGSMDPLTGGPCQGIRNTVPILQKSGIYSEVVCMDDPNSSYLGTDSFVINAIGPGKTPWLYSTRLIPWLIENLMRFDVVIVNGLWQFHSYAIHSALEKLRKSKLGSLKDKLPKVYVMPHGMLDPYFQKAPERRLKALRNWLFWKLVERKTVNNAEGLLFTCQTELLLAREAFQPYSPKKEFNIGYGIENPPLYNQQMQAEFYKKCPQLENSKYLLFLSRIHHKKGTDMLVNAYLQLYQEAESQASLPKLLIAGPGLDTEYGQEIERLAAGANGNIIFCGMISGDTKWGAFYNADAFVLPSHQENFGIAVVEALACSVPVLISDQVNIWREIDNEQAGLIAPDNTEGTYNMLKQWVSLSAEEKFKMKEQAASCFKKHFSIAPAALKMAQATQISSQDLK